MDMYGNPSESSLQQDRPRTGESSQRHPNQMPEPPQLAPFLMPRSTSPNSNSPQMSMSSCYVAGGKSKMVRRTERGVIHKDVYIKHNHTSINNNRLVLIQLTLQLIVATLLTRVHNQLELPLVIVPLWWMPHNTNVTYCLRTCLCKLNLARADFKGL